MNGEKFTRWLLLSGIYTVYTKGVFKTLNAFIKRHVFYDDMTMNVINANVILTVD